MSVQRTIYCDAADCERHASTATPPPYCPTGFLSVQWWSPGNEPYSEYHFCSWDCVLKHAAAQPPSIVIPWDQPAEEAA